MITGSSYDPNSKNKSTENMHIPSISLLQLILTQCVKEEIRELHAIFLSKKHHLVFMSPFYCIRTSVVICL